MGKISQELHGYIFIAAQEHTVLKGIRYSIYSTVYILVKMFPLWNRKYYSQLKNILINKVLKLSSTKEIGILNIKNI